MISVVKNLVVKLFSSRLIRYIFSGGTAAVVDLGLLYIFVHFLHMWYILAASIAFIVAFCVSFLMQKFLTFGELSKERVPKQLVLYFVVALANLGLNALFMYIEVDLWGLHYMVAQFLASGFIALYSFFVYKHFIFHENDKLPTDQPLL